MNITRFVPHIFLIGVLVCVVSACTLFTSWNALGNSWHGQSIDRIIDLWGEPESVTSTTEGTTEHKYHLKKLDPNCIHIWIVDPEGIIVGHRYSGWCTPIG